MTKEAYTTSENDVEIVLEWLSGLHPRIERFYTEDIQALFDVVQKPLIQVNRNDIIQAISNHPSVARRRLSAIRSFFSFAVAQRYLSYNIAHDIPPLRAKPSRTDQQSLSEADIMSLLDCPDLETRCFLALLYYCAMSAIEIAAMRWSDVAMEGDQAILTVREPHTRRVILPPFVWSNLSKLHRVSDIMFPSRVGGRPLDVHSIRRRVRLFGQSIGITIKPHMLRTSHAHHAIARGATLTQIQQSMGHASSRSTTRYFDAVEPTDVATSSLLIRPK